LAVFWSTLVGSILSGFVTILLFSHQIKLKKTNTDTQPSTVPPVMVNAPPATHNYAPMNSANATGGMILPSITYAQQDTHASQQVPGMAYTGGSYAYPNTYMSVPMTNQGGDTHGYYNYNTGNMGQNAPSGQMMQPQMVPQQPAQQQMYVPQQFQMASMPSTGANTGVAYPTMNYTASYAPPGNSYGVAGQTQQMQPQQQQQNMMQSTNGQQMQYVGNNANTMQNNNNGKGSMPQQMMPAQQGYSQFPGMSAPMSTYNSMPPQGGSTMLYTQQMVAPVPTSYYGNSSVSSAGSSGAVTNGGVTQQSSLSQPMSYTTYAPVVSTQSMPGAAHTQYGVNTGIYNPNKDSSNQPQQGGTMQ
jgi:hypothetical protein